VDISVCTTYYDPRSRRCGMTEYSGKRHGIRMDNFGWGSKFDGFLRTKLVPMREYLRRQKTEFCLFLDGNDLIITSPLEDIFKTWDSMGGGVVVGSEIQIWPYVEMKQFLIDRATAQFPDTPDPAYRSIDTGFIMGKRKDVLDILDVVIDSEPKYQEEMPDTPIEIIEDDVGLFALNLRDGKIDFKIDYRCDLIVPMKSTLDKWYIIKEGKLHLSKTGSVPHIVHCNGGKSKSRFTARKLTTKLLGVRKTKVGKY